MANSFLNETLNQISVPSICSDAVTNRSKKYNDPDLYGDYGLAQTCEGSFIKKGDHVFFLRHEFVIVQSPISNRYYLGGPKSDIFWENFKKTENWKNQYYSIIGQIPPSDIPTFKTIDDLIKFNKQYKSNVDYLFTTLNGIAVDTSIKIPVEPANKKPIITVNKKHIKNIFKKYEESIPF